MDGERIPVVFFPRYSTFTGADTDYLSQPVDMLAFTFISATFYRGIVTGTDTPTVEFWMQESADLNEWETVVDPFDPSETGNVAATKLQEMPIRRRYVRVGVRLDGTNPSVTCFAIGWAARTQP